MSGSEEDGSAEKLRIGSYEVQRLLGVGGMGTVYEARQENPRRVVALKVLNSGRGAREGLRRFEFEIQTLARLHHPGIAQVYEAGTHESEEGPQPFFSMELVPGARTLVEYADHKELTVEERLVLFEQVCEAVAYAHQRGVIHRDLKPANILVDSRGTPKVIDFGVARGTDEDSGALTTHTQAGQIVGTLQYLSPEQCDGDPFEVDLRTDVYALGIVLYELLTGELPYTLEGLPLHQVLLVIQGKPPRLLSELRPGIVGDLDVIGAKSIEKNRDHRYASAADLAADLVRFRSGEPILARPPSTVELVRRLVLRHRIAAVAAGVSLMSLVAAVLLISTYALRARVARKEAEVNEARAISASARALAGEQEALEFLAVAERNAYAAHLATAQAAIGARDLLTARARLDLAARQPGARQRWEWRYLDARTDDSLMVLRGHEQMVLSLDWHSDGRRLLSASIDGTARIWDTQEGVELRQLQDLADGAAEGGPGLIHAQLSPDETRVATAGLDAVVRISDFESGELLHRLEGHTQLVCTLDFSPDGRRLASGSYDGRIGIWQVQSGTLERWIEAHEGSVNLVRFLAGGQVLSATSEREIKTWASEDGTLLSELGGEGVPPVESGAIDSQGTRLATGGHEDRVMIWDLEHMEARVSLLGHGGVVTTLAFGAQDRQLFSGSHDNTLRIWDLESGLETAAFIGHRDQLMGLALHPQGELVASSGGHNDRTIRLWPTDPAPFATELPGGTMGGGAAGLGFSADGSRAFAVGGSGRVWVWDVALGELVCELFIGDSQVDRAEGDLHVWSAVSDRVGRHLFIATRDHGLFAVDLRTGSSLRVLEPLEDAEYCSLAVSPDGERLALSTSAGQVRLLSCPAPGQPCTVIADLSVPCPPSDIPGQYLLTGTHFDPISGDILTLDWTGTIWRVDPKGGAALPAFTGHASQGGLVVAPDGSVYGAAPVDGTSSGRSILRWEAGRAQPTARLEGHQGAVRSLALHPGGRLLSSISLDRTMRLWDLETCTEVLSIPLPRIGRALAWDADGRRVLTGLGVDGGVLLHDSQPLRERYAARQTALRHRQVLEPLVDDWAAETSDPDVLLSKMEQADILTAEQKSLVGLLLLRRLTELGETGD